MHNFKLGMAVRFGRPNGEQTLGQIVKLNPTKAKVMTTENRGSKSPAGAVWTVPYSLMTAVSDSDHTQIPAPTKPKLEYNPFCRDNGYYELIMGCYSALSPENLSGDGMVPRNIVNQRRAEYNRRLRGLFMAIGREVDECEIYDWWHSKQESLKQTAK